MTTFVILLRGVTPSGKNKVPMARLREVLEDAGFTHVRTYIQSGNVLIDTSLTAQEVEERVRDIIKNSYRCRSGSDSPDRGTTGKSAGWKPLHDRVRHIPRVLRFFC